MPVSARVFIATLQIRMEFHFRSSVARDGVSSELGWDNDIALKAVFLNPQHKGMDDFTSPNGRHNMSQKNYTIEMIRAEINALLPPELSSVPVEHQGEEAMELESLPSSSSSSWFDFGNNFSGSSSRSRPRSTDEGALRRTL